MAIVPGLLLPSLVACFQIVTKGLSVNGHAFLIFVYLGALVVYFACIYTGSLPLGSHTSIFALSIARENCLEETHSSNPSSLSLFIISRSKEQPLFLFALLRTFRSIAGLRYSHSIPSFVSFPGNLQRAFNAATDTLVASAACSIVSNSYVCPSGNVTLHDVSLQDGLKKNGFIIHKFS